MSYDVQGQPQAQGPRTMRLRNGFIVGTDGSHEPTYGVYVIKDDYDAVARDLAACGGALNCAHSALQQIHDSHSAYCEHHVGVSQHSHDLAQIADEALTELRSPGNGERQ